MFVVFLMQAVKHGTVEVVRYHRSVALSVLVSLSVTAPAPVSPVVSVPGTTGHLVTTSVPDHLTLANVITVVLQ